MRGLAKFHLGGAEHGKHLALGTAQMAQKKFPTACLGQGKLNTRVNRSNVIQMQRSLWHLQDVRFVWSDQLHSQRLVNGNVGGVHICCRRGQRAWRSSDRIDSSSSNLFF